MTPLVLVVALAAGPPRSLPLLKPASPTALVALRMRGGAADQEMKQSDVDAMRTTLVAVRSRVVRSWPHATVLAVVIDQGPRLYVKPVLLERRSPWFFLYVTDWARFAEF